MFSERTVNKGAMINVSLSTEAQIKLHYIWPQAISKCSSLLFSLDGCTLHEECSFAHVGAPI